MAYDGENLCHRGDVAVVTLNHRLNVLGWRYAASGNVGMLDLVAALEWVRDNIARFGGDPGNVMIFGQSGGGWKVSLLMAMPAAQGLFHRAVVQSGSAIQSALPEESGRLAAAVLVELGMTAGQLELDKLHELPIESLIAAGQAATCKMARPVGMSFDIGTAMRSIGWSPTVDGNILPRHPFDPTAPAVFVNVPLLVGAIRIRVAGVDRGRTHPPGRRDTGRTQGRARLPEFAWRTPVLDGKLGTFHACDIAFVFDNIDRYETYTSGAPEARVLAAQISQSWINFARCGDPNPPALLHWPAYSAGRGQTMIFDNPCSVQDDPDREARRVLMASNQ